MKILGVTMMKTITMSGKGEKKMENATERKYTQLSKSRSRSTREVIISRVEPSGRYKLAELAQMDEGGHKFKRFVKGGIEIESLELLAGLYDAIRIALTAEGYYDEEKEEISVDLDLLNAQSTDVKARDDAAALDQINIDASQIVSEMIENVDLSVEVEPIVTSVDSKEADWGVEGQITPDEADEAVEIEALEMPKFVPDENPEETKEADKLAVALDQGLISQEQFDLLNGIGAVTEDDVPEEEQDEGFEDWEDDVPDEDWDK